MAAHGTPLAIRSGRIAAFRQAQLRFDTPGGEGSFAGSVFSVRIAVITGLMLQLALSSKLWLSSRFYPQTPVFHFLRPVPPPLDQAVYLAMFLLLAWAAVAAKPARTLFAFLGIAAAYALFDQSRWQPWFYQYLLMLLAVSVFYRDPPGTMRRESALDACRLIVAGVYFWSGLHKFNSGFTSDMFPWMVQPFARWLPGTGWLQWAAIAAAVAETAIGVCLITGVFRRTAVAVAVAMHVFILASLGPLGHNWNQVVWPWNVMMCWLVVLLFWRREPPGGIGRLWIGRPIVFKAVLLLVGLAPALNFAGLLDDYLSFSLYSGNRNGAVLYMADSVADRLPDEMQENISVNDSGVDELDLYNWSFAELNVPPYIEVRVFQQVGKEVCRAAGNPREMALVIRSKSTWLRRKRLLAYDCAGLLR